MSPRDNRTDDESAKVGADRPESNPQSHRYRTSATVVGLFLDRDDATRAIDDLRAAGFSDSEIGIAMQDKDEQQSLTDETGTPAADGAAKGAISGGIAGGAIAFIASLIPGIGPILAGGVLGTTLAGIGIGAASGGVIGVLVGLGMSKEDAEHFDRQFRDGGILVTVGADERVMEARSILRDRGGDLGPSNADSASTGRSVSDSPAGSSVSRGWENAPRDRVEDQWADEETTSFPERERRQLRDLIYQGQERRHPAS